MSTLSEVTDEHEVASLLARLEAGSREREALRFRSLLRTFEREHDARAAPPAAPGDAHRRQGEIVDLTRAGRRGLGGLLLGRRGIA
jgi:hypothetical protein